MRFSTIIIAATAATILATPAAKAGISNPSNYRQIDANGVGNCVFSPQELPYQNESAPGYRAIKTEFSEGENVHVRCYWAKTASEFQNVGRIWNSIRDNSRFHSSLIWVRPPELKADAPDFFINSVQTPVDAQFAAADQQRFDIVEASDCDFQIINFPKQEEYGVSSPNNCIDLAGFARAMRPKYALSDPATFEFCVQQYVEAADTETPRQEWDRTLGRYRYSTQRNEYRHLMARGCFTYRLND